MCAQADLYITLPTGAGRAWCISVASLLVASDQRSNDPHTEQNGTFFPGGRLELRFRTNYVVSWSGAESCEQDLLKEGHVL